MLDKGKKLSEKKWLDDEEKLVRLAVMLAREVDRIVFDLGFKRDILIHLWSKERVRAPLLRVLDAKFYDLPGELLVLFPPDLYQALDDFYRSLDTFIFYASYTEDMPQNLSAKFDAFLEEIKAMAEPLIEKLKAVDPAVARDLMAFEPPMPDLAEL